MVVNTVVRQNSLGQMSPDKSAPIVGALLSGPNCWEALLSGYQLTLNIGVLC